MDAPECRERAVALQQTRGHRGGHARDAGQQACGKGLFSIGLQHPIAARDASGCSANTDRYPILAQALFARGITTSAIEAGRAVELRTPVLRASFHAYADEDDVDALVQALAAVS